MLAMKCDWHQMLIFILHTTINILGWEGERERSKSVLTGVNTLFSPVLSAFTITPSEHSHPTIVMIREFFLLSSLDFLG